MKLDMTRGALHATLFLLVLTFALFAANLLFTAHEINSIRSSITASQHATASVVQLCEAGNETRAEQAGLWAYLIHLSPPAPDKAARAREVKFEQHLQTVFAPRNCTAITR